MASRSKERIPVYLRVRPCPNGAERALRVVDGNTVEIFAPGAEGLVHRGEFSRIFDEDVSQLGVFRDSVLPLVENVSDRQRDALLITYGASGSGKTYTISGLHSRSGGTKRDKQLLQNKEESCLDDVKPGEGVLPRALRCLFRTLGTTSDQMADFYPTNFSDMVRTKAAQKHSVPLDLSRVKRSSEDKSGIWLSVVQVFNEVVTDLLNPTNAKPLSLAQDSNSRCFVKDASWHRASSEQVAIRLLTDARARQEVATTKLNDVSSRSHFIVFVKLVRCINNELKVNQLVFADLAGNERAAATGTSGDLLRQAGFINCSLLVLGRCVDAIRRGLRNIPYRESKLTRLLSPFLSGKGPLLSILVCVNPHKERVEDTLSTIKFSALASELTQAAEVVKRFQETRRRSASAAVTGDDPFSNHQGNVTVLPKSVFKAMQQDLALGQRLAEENENLRKSLQLAEEALENSRLMHQDRVATMREEFRAETRKIREEHREAREMLERELHQHCNDLAEKCKKYKKQAAQIAEVLKKRLYPELEEYRSRYGTLTEFPTLQEEELEMYGQTSDALQNGIACSRCFSFKTQFDEASRQLQIKNQQCERMVSELRAERELRVLLQERTRAEHAMTILSGDSALDYTCVSQPVAPRQLQVVSPSESGDSGHESENHNRKSLTEEDQLVTQLRQEIDELREKLLQQLAMTEHVEITSRDRIAEMEHELEQEHSKRQMLEIARDELVARLQDSTCNLGCDRCKQIMRLREVPKTLPCRLTSRNRSPGVTVRESRLAYTPVFRRATRTSSSVETSPSKRRRRRKLLSSDEDK